MMHYTIIENFLTLLRAGAFNDVSDATTVEMSRYKWRRLRGVAAEQGVLRYVVLGGERIAPGIDELRFGEVKLDEAEFDVGEGCFLFNRWTERRLEDVREGEMNLPTTSDESLHVLDLIVSNANIMVRGGLSLAGIVALGRYLRENVKLIDFEKVTTWLQRANLVQVASYLGSLLMDCFDFAEDDVPFVARYYSSGRRELWRCLERSGESCRFPLSARLNIALIETCSFYFKRVTSVITEIEE